MLFPLYFLTFNDLLKWIRLGGSPDESCEISLLNCHFERRVHTRVRYAHLYASSWESSRTRTFHKSLESSQCFPMGARGGAWLSIILSSPLHRLKRAWPTVRDMKFLDRCFNEIRSCSEIRTDLRSYVLLIIY